MICRYCGKEIPDESVYCPECGLPADGLNGEENIANKQTGSLLNKVPHASSSLKHQPPVWMKALLGIEVIAVILGFFLISAALETPGSRNRELNTVKPDFSNILPGSDSKEYGQQFHSAVQGLSCGEEMFQILNSRAASPHVEYIKSISQVRFDEFETTMDLSGGPCLGKYIIIYNDNDVPIDAKAEFSFYDTQGKLADSSTFDEYGIAAHGTGIVVGQTAEQDVSHIDRRISVSPSDYVPVSDCVSYTVKDNGKKGINVTVNNHSDLDIKDFRIRVLWFQNSRLETVAYRWLELGDHTFYSGRKKSLDFKRKWGDEKYMIILQGKAMPVNRIAGAGDGGNQY